MALRYDRLYLVREEGDRLIGELVQDVAPYHSFLLDPKDTGKPTEQGKERPMNLRIYGSQTNELYLGLVPGTPNPGDVHLAVVDPATGAAVKGGLLLRLFMGKGDGRLAGEPCSFIAPGLPVRRDDRGRWST